MHVVLRKYNGCEPDDAPRILKFDYADYAVIALRARACLYAPFRTGEKQIKVDDG